MDDLLVHLYFPSFVDLSLKIGIIRIFLKSRHILINISYFVSVGHRSTPVEKNISSPTSPIPSFRSLTYLLLSLLFHINSSNRIDSDSPTLLRQLRKLIESNARSDSKLLDQNKVPLRIENRISAA